MTRNFAIEVTVAMLEKARDAAVSAGLESHFVSDICHLIETACANREEEK